MTRLVKSLRTGPVRILTTAALLVAFGAATVTVGADAEQPRSNDRYITHAVSFFLRHQHLSGHPLDDEISERGFELYLKSLDPLKLYFNRSDIDEFARQNRDLDDMARRGDVTFAYTVYKRLLQRMDERLAIVEELLKEDHDFTVDEEMIADRDLMAYAANEDEARQRWRKRIKYDLLLQKLDNKTGEEALDKLRKRYHGLVRRMQQTSSDELLEMFLTALTTSYDPHTTYMSAETLENFEIQMRLELDGIGAALSQTLDGTTTISRIVPGGAADRAGQLKAKDEVIGVGQGESGEIVDTGDMKLNDIVHLIRGKRGTIVRLKVIPNGETESTVYQITRDRIELTDSEARGEIIEEGGIKVGVIDLPSFYMDMEGARLNKPDFKSTTRDVQRLLENFRAKGVDAVMIDLRLNGGGSLTEAINLTGLFIDEGPVVQVKDTRGDVQHYDDLERGTAWDGPLVVLTSKLSASASEIFAGAIQDYGRGIIVGDETTHGKGTVQSLLDLTRQIFQLADGAPKMGALKLTMQQFYRPSGDSTQERGVMSDIVLPSVTAHLFDGESDLDYAVKFDRVEAAPFRPLTLVNRATLDQLRAKSKARRAESEEFQKLAKDIARLEAQKKRKAISLNEKKFMAERSEAKNPLEDDEDEDQEDPDQVVKRTFYFNEALAITVDYVRALRTAARR